VSKEKTAETIVHIDHVNFFYGAKQALLDICMEIPPKMITAFRER